MAAKNTKNKIFVYGTLKRGLRNHYLLKEAPEDAVMFAGEAKLVEKHGLCTSDDKRLPFLLPLEPREQDNATSVTSRYQVVTHQQGIRGSIL